jgi:sigma-B regulation protein RsbU (phosphoserine phosphatase)
LESETLMTQQISLRKLQQELTEKKHLLELVNAELSREIAERKRAEEAEKALLHKLGERVKELNCLYGMSRLVETPGITLDGVLQAAADLIPPAWQYPEITCARIILDGQEFRTENYKKSQWKQTADIQVHGKASGVVEVRYLEAKPGSDDAAQGEGSFLQEERNLIDAIAEQLGNTIERVRAEKELLAASERLERQNAEILEQKDLLDGLLQHSPLAVVINDLKHRIVIVNPAFRTLFGYSQDETIGANLDDLLSTPETVQEMRQLSNQGLVEPVNTEGKRKRKDGTLVDVEILSVPFFVGGGQFGYLVFYHDISDRRDVEASLEKTQRTYTAILDTLEDAYFEADPLGVLTYVNSAFCDAMGYQREEIIGRHFRNLVDRRTFREVLELFGKLYETKQPIRGFEGHYRRRDGEVLVGEWSVSPILRGDDVVGSRGLIRDITARVRAQAALRVTRDEAEARAKDLAAINRVAESVSHSLDLTDILHSVCVELTTIFPVRNAGIALLNPERTSLEILAFHSIDPQEESAQGRSLPLEGNTESQELIAAMQTVVIQDAQTDPRTRPIHELSRARGSRSFMVVPLVTRGRAIGTLGMPATEPKHEFSDTEIELAETIASQIATAVDNARLHAQTEMALDVAERDLEIGREIQSGFFPETLPTIEGFEAMAHFQAARQVSGDFYDLFRIGSSDHYGLVIADVCDKGVGAALFMVLFRSLVRSFSEQHRHFDRVDELLRDIVSRLNNYIAQTHGHSNMFATMILGILDPATNVLYYVNGGHEPPIVLNTQGQITARLEPTGPAVGLMPDLPFVVGSLALAPGDSLIAYTDGIPEARDVAGEFYTEERLLQQCAQPWESAFSVVKQLEADVFAHIGEIQQSDDVTLIVLRRRLADQRSRHHFSLKAVLPNLPLLRGFVVEACQLMGMGDDATQSLKLAVDEACANLILHGYQGIEPGAIRLSVEHLGDSVQVQIQDDGHAFHPDLAAPPELDAEVQDRELGGLGVFFIKEMVDKLSYESSDGVNRMTLIKSL